MKLLELEQQLQREQKKKRFKKEIISWGKTLVVVMLIVVFIRGFLFTNYIVFGQSMMPTIENNERVIINKIGYDIGTPKRFDMIVFHATETSDYIKRIIGLPGDEIEYKDDVLYINGEAIDETHLNGAVENYVNSTYTDDFSLEELTGVKSVPENHLFVLGDNRRNSIDSRQIGFIHYDQVVGKADIAYWPITKLRKLN